MHFKAGSKEPKATLEIGDKTYKIAAPLVGQSVQITKDLEALSDNPIGQHEKMKEFISELGSVPVEDLDKIENDLLLDLFWHIVTPKKK